MQSLPVFISSASCRAQVIIKRKKQISKTTLLFIHIQTKKADKYEGGSRVLSFSHNTRRFQIQGVCFKSGDLIMGIAVMGLVCRNQGLQLWLHELEL